MINSLTENGKIYTGVNYWASHAAINMWTEWDADIVESDFKKLAEARVEVLRVFPLWSVFQPIKAHYVNDKTVYEYRLGEEPLTDDDAGIAGISVAAMERFQIMTELAMKYGLKLIVALLTGFMSSRLFLPEALEGGNAINDPNVIRWEVRYVDYFVKRFKDCDSIIAWDLGNECNLMSRDSTRDQAYAWTALISNTIRAADPTRPVVSGMAMVYPEGSWTIQDQAELTDILTTHPYHIFQASIDPINTIRPLLHPVVSVLVHEGLGGKPCFIEEVGAIGYMNVSENVEGDYMRGLLFNAWAYNNRGLLWWCAFDQGHMSYTPYDWNTIGSDYGYYRADGTMKPVAEEAIKFDDLLNTLPFDTLPPRIVDAVCIIPRGLDNSVYRIAINTFALAKQANIDIEFQYAEQPLKESKIYIMPSIKGYRSMSRHRLMPLLEKIKSGAVLYLSLDDCLLRWFPELTGMTVATRERYAETDTIMLGDIKLPIKGPFRYEVEKVTGEVLAVDQDGRPVFVCNNYGKGKIYCLTAPLERYLSEKCGAFHYENAAPYYEIYRKFVSEVRTNRIAYADNPQIGLTEHEFQDGSCVIIAINYSAKPQNAVLKVSQGWKISECFYGSIDNFKLYIRQNDAVVLRVVKKVDL